jgi:hypothetical protein
MARLPSIEDALRAVRSAGDLETLGRVWPIGHPLRKAACRPASPPDERDVLRRRAVVLAGERPVGGTFFRLHDPVRRKAAARFLDPHDEGRFDPLHAVKMRMVQDTIMRKRSAAVARGQEVGGRTRPKESQVQKQLEGMGKRGASKLSKLKRAEVHRAIREHAMSVEANDDDGDWSLTFSEFKRLVEHRLPKLSFGRKTLLA